LIYRSNSYRPPDRRQQMIDETGAFLTWALRSGASLPKIPRRRVDAGGFAQLLRSPGAKAAVNHWWNRTLEIVEGLRDR
jgi:hypothetical protein